MMDTKDQLVTVPQGGALLLHTQCNADLIISHAAPSAGGLSGGAGGWPSSLVSQENFILSASVIYDRDKILMRLIQHAGTHGLN